MAFTFIALATVDRWGRRSLMLFGCAGIAASHLLIGLAYLLKLKGLAVLLFSLAAIGCYGMSLAPVTWVLISEIFPNRIRGAAISVAVSALWIACFILTYTFPLLERAIGTGNTFWLYSAICLAASCSFISMSPKPRASPLNKSKGKRPRAAELASPLVEIPLQGRLFTIELLAVEKADNV